MTLNNDSGSPAVSLFLLAAASGGLYAMYLITKVAFTKGAFTKAPELWLILFSL